MFRIATLILAMTASHAAAVDFSVQIRRAEEAYADCMRRADRWAETGSTFSAGNLRITCQGHLRNAERLRAAQAGRARGAAPAPSAATSGAGRDDDAFCRAVAADPILRSVMSRREFADICG